MCALVAGRRGSPNVIDSREQPAMSRLRSPLLRPEDLLRAAQRADETAKELKRIVSWLVVEAHDRGVTWDGIGATFGVSRQAVHDRFGPNSRALRRGDHGRPKDGHR